MRTLPKLIANLPLAMVMGAAVAEESTFNLNIPAQPLAAAIEAVSKQTGLQPFYADGALVGKQSPALKGSYSKREAVEKLLAQSGLDYTSPATTRWRSRRLPPNPLKKQRQRSLWF
jgi:hypothetical protein